MPISRRSLAAAQPLGLSAKMRRGGSRPTCRSCRGVCVEKINELAVEEGGDRNPPRNFHVPKARKYPCCIRIERESTKQNGQAKLILFIKGHQVEATQTQTTLLACLHQNKGHVVSYKQLVRVLGQKSTAPEQLHILRQYASWITKTLAAHKALCILAVAPRVGYVLCEHD
jgi:hypothetical protein